MANMKRPPICRCPECGQQNEVRYLDAEKARADKLWSALAGLLDDTQHAEHTCHDDPSCPVDAARRILEECR